VATWKRQTSYYGHLTLAGRGNGPTSLTSPSKKKEAIQADPPQDFVRVSKTHRPRARRYTEKEKKTRKGAGRLAYLPSSV